MSDLKDLPSEGATNFPQRTRETLQTLIGTRGDRLDRAVRLRDLVASGLIALRPGVSAGGGGGVGIGVGTVPLVPGPGLTDSAIYVEDLTPPPTPDGFAVDAAISHIFITHNAPTYTQGHGHLRTRLYGVSILPGDPLPTFSDAVELTQFGGTTHAHPSNPATTWRLWIKWESRDNVLSPSPAGGTNGLETRTGENVSQLLTALSGKITESQLFADLGSRINLIDGTGPGSVTSRLAAEVAARAAAIRAATDALESTDGALQDQIDLLASAAGGDLSELLEVVNQERDDRIAAVLFESNARGLADTTISGALSNEEAARQISDATLGAVASLLTAELGASSAAVATAQTASATGDAALANQQQTLRATVENATAAIQVEQTTRATADDAAASRTTALVAQVGSSAAAIRTEQDARSTADSASASRVDVLAAVTGAASAAIRTEQDARTTDASALAARSDTLGVQFGQALAGITTEQQARIDADGVQAGQTTGLLVALPGVQASVHAEQQARVTDDAALAQQTALLGAFVGNAASAILAEQSARASSDSAQASQIVTLTATAAGNTASISTEADVRALQTGELYAQYTVKTDVGGLVSGYGLASSANNAAPTSAFGVRASQFFVAPPTVNQASAPTANLLYPGFVWRNSSTGLVQYWTGSAWSTTPQALPFVVQPAPTTINGVLVPAGVYMRDAFIQNGTITNAKIGNAQIDDAKIASLSADKITTGTLAAQRIAADSITAEKIDSRGLSIKDASGKLILSSGGDGGSVWSRRPNFVRSLLSWSVGSTSQVVTLVPETEDGTALQISENAAYFISRSQNINLKQHGTKFTISFKAYYGGPTGYWTMRVELFPATLPSGGWIPIYSGWRNYSFTIDSDLADMEDCRLQIYTGDNPYKLMVGDIKIGPGDQATPWTPSKLDSVSVHNRVTSGNASTWIADAAIGSAQIAEASILSAKIADASITTAKIVDASVDTLKIGGRQVTVPYYFQGRKFNSITNGAFFSQTIGVSANPLVVSVSLQGRAGSWRSNSTDISVNFKLSGVINDAGFYLNFYTTEMPLYQPVGTRGVASGFSFMISPQVAGNLTITPTLSGAQFDAGDLTFFVQIVEYKR